MKTKSKFVISAGIIVAVIISTQYGNSGVTLFNLTEDNSNGNNSEGTKNNSKSEVSFER